MIVLVVRIEGIECSMIYEIRDIVKIFVLNFKIFYE